MDAERRMERAARALLEVLRPDYDGGDDDLDEAMDALRAAMDAAPELAPVADPAQAAQPAQPDSARRPSEAGVTAGETAPSTALLFAYAECAEAWDQYLASIRTGAEAERAARLDRILVKHGYTEDCMSVRDWIVNLRARALCECNA